MHKHKDVVEIHVYKVASYELDFNKAKKTPIGVALIYWKQLVSFDLSTAPRVHQFKVKLENPYEELECQMKGKVMGEAYWIPKGYQGQGEQRLNSRMTGDALAAGG